MKIKADFPQGIVSIALNFEYEFIVLYCGLPISDKKHKEKNDAIFEANLFYNAIKGLKKAIPKVLLNYQDYVFLLHLSKKVYRVVYGLHSKDLNNIQDALNEFNACVLHGYINAF